MVDSMIDGINDSTLLNQEKLIYTSLTTFFPLSLKLPNATSNSIHSLNFSFLLKSTDLIHSFTNFLAPFITRTPKKS